MAGVTASSPLPERSVVFQRLVPLDVAGSPAVGARFFDWAPMIACHFGGGIRLGRLQTYMFVTHCILYRRCCRIYAIETILDGRVYAAGPIWKHLDLTLLRFPVFVSPYAATHLLKEPERRFQSHVTLAWQLHIMLSVRFRMF